MRRITLILITLILSALFLVSHAFADEGKLQAANVLYENGNFPAAIQAYQQLVNQGTNDANLFYNLGNAYYQTGALGQAILNYRRAEQIAPRDPDIQHNLRLARQQVTEQFKQAPDNIVDIFLTDVSERFSLNEMAVIALALWTVLCLMIMALSKFDKGRFKTTLKYHFIPLVLFFVLALFTLSSRLYITQISPEAVIVAEGADVYTGPGTQFDSDYQLPTGVEVTLYQSRGDWAQISVPGSTARGWVPATAVAAVN